MSQVTQFLEKVEGDQDLKQKFSTLESNDQVVEFGKSLGFSFTIEDYEKELQEKVDLDKVVGGAAMGTGFTTCPRTTT